MNIFSLFKSFVEEHFSAAVQKDRLQLMSEELASRDLKIAQLAVHVEQLNIAIKDLNTELKACKSECDRLNNFLTIANNNLAQEREDDDRFPYHP